MAIGSKIEEKIAKENNLEIDKRGFVKIDETYKTNIEKVYAGGDFAGGKGTVSSACRSGRNAAEEIMKDLSNQEMKRMEKFGFFEIKM